VISEEDRDRIIDIGRRFGVSKILLFGSAASESNAAKDIDLAVSGVPASRFFEFYGELLFSLSKPVDLIDLSRDSRFTRMVLAEGIPLYG